MKRFTICKTVNGYLVVIGDWDYNTSLDRYLSSDRIASFNGLDAAMAYIRKQMKPWHQPATPKP